MTAPEPRLPDPRPALVAALVLLGLIVAWPALAYAQDGADALSEVALELAKWAPIALTAVGSILWTAKATCTHIQAIAAKLADGNVTVRLVLVDDRTVKADDELSALRSRVARLEQGEPKADAA